MVAPTPTARVTPPGRYLWDGFATKITFAADSNVDLWEKSVQPPGLDGGDAIDTSTMFNTKYRTMRSRSLITSTEAKMTCAYDPAVNLQLESLINVETTITLTFPDGSTLAFFGYLKTFEPSDVEEGEQPEADVTIQPTNWDVAGNVEEGPVGSYIAGT